MKYRVLASVVILVFCALPVLAQSGRRQTKPAPSAPVPTPTPEATPTPKKEDKKSDLLFFLGADRNDSYANFPYSYYDAALRGCADRLRAGSSAGVDVSQQPVSRGDAIKKAKAETNSYVVYMKLTYDSMARSYDEIILEFVVFAPTTAKVAMSGRSYLNSNRAGPLIVGPTGRGSTSILYREQLLKQAGEDAGNRILKSLHLDIEVPKHP
ncbi:MAG TPA: hypothetical protein VGQ41_01045 [Pyrinomonadaceae bacterium]|jgi:hypothetical protein|nr:hypothetical protein [Pyrinomonadaceae bacterium]